MKQQKCHKLEKSYPQNRNLQKNPKKQSHCNENKPENKQPASLQKKQAQIRGKTTRLATLLQTCKPNRTLTSERAVSFWRTVAWHVNVVNVTRGGSSRRAAGLQPSLKNVRLKIPPNGQTRLVIRFSYEISQHNHFRYSWHHFGSTFPRNPTKPMFRSLPTTPLMRWRFQHTCRLIWQFRGCLRHCPKGKKPTICYKKCGGISAYRKAFLLFWRWIFEEKTKEIWSRLFFTTWFSWIMNFIIKFNNAFTSTLANLDSNLVANLGLRKRSPSFICTSAACNSRLSWWAF